jgi:hypothetical protein
MYIYGMKPIELQRTYLETSVISYLSSKQSRDPIIKARQMLTKKWWGTLPKTIEPFISVYVIEEIEKGDKSAAKHRIEAVKNIQILDTSELIVSFSNVLHKWLKIPDSARLDALHLAVAAVHNMDTIISWNFKHMANPNVRRIYKAICISEGFISPDISTPEELLGE